MKAKQKFLSILLVFSLVLTMIPTTVFAADTHKVAIYTQQSGMGSAGTNGVVSNTYYQVNSEGVLNSESANEANYNIYYDEGSAQLTINNLQTASNKSLLVPGGTTINILGTNRIELVQGESSGGGIGVVSDGNITITGNGSLYISSSSQAGISRANLNNSYSAATTKGGVLINGDVELIIDHMGAASCISANGGDITIGGNAEVTLDPRAGKDKDNDSIIYSNGGNITIQDNAKVNSTGGLDTTGTGSDGSYGKVTIKGSSNLTITNTNDRGVSLRGAGGVEVSENATLAVSSNTKSGQALVATSGAIKIAGEAEINMINPQPTGNAALFATDIEVTGKLTVNGGTNGLYINGGNAVKFNGADVKISNCMIGVSAAAQITNSLVELDTTLKAFNSTTNASLTNDYAVFAGTASANAIFVPHKNGTVEAGTWGKAYVRIAPHTCTYDQQIVSEQYKATDADCTNAASYYYSCVCGAKGSETFKSGEATGHSWSAWIKDAESDTHTRTCSSCHAEETENCAGGTATCTNKATCVGCGSEYGTIDSSNHTGAVVWVQTEISHKQVYNCCNSPVSEEEEHQWENGTCTICLYPCAHTGGEATCSQKAICEICNSQYGELNPNNHRAATNWTQEDGKHYHQCENGCGTHLDEAACSGGAATCTAKALCEVCGNSYGEKNPANHTGTVEWIKTETTHKSVFACCGEKVVAEEPHEWESGMCIECGYACQHSGGEATCTSQAICKVCGENYGALKPHSLIKTEEKPATHTEAGHRAYWTCSDCGKLFADEKGSTEIGAPEVIPSSGHSFGTEWKSDANDHWHECACGKKADAAAHTFGDWTTTKAATATEAGSREKSCIVCGYKVAESIPATGTGGTTTPTDSPKPNPETNVVSNTPQTGDPFNVWLFVGLLFIGTAGLATLTILQLKRKKSEK